MSTNVRQMMRLVTALTAAVFFLSAAMNFGLRIALGSVELGFSMPLMSTGMIEVVIGLALVAAAAISRPYVYGAAYILAIVGIVEGLLSTEVQGLARSLHEVMVPLAIVGCALLALETQRAYRTRAYRGKGETGRRLIIALQFFVGGLVVLGGSEYARNGTYPFGTALGLIHLVVGFTGLFAGYAVLRRKTWSRGLLIAVNSVTIAYSAFSESAAQIYFLLPPGIGDALIGTVIAILVSGVILFLVLLRSPEQWNDDDRGRPPPRRKAEA